MSSAPGVDSAFELGRPDGLPAVGEVHLWWIDLAVGADDLEACRRLLDPAELEQASRFRFDRHRRRFTVRRAQLRRLLGDYLVMDPRRVAFVLGDREKPYLAPSLHRDPKRPLHFNLSDSQDVAVVGVQVGQELGVDVEVVRPMEDALSISRHFFAEAEQQILAQTSPSEIDATFFRCWTRKEAYIKAIGQGLAVPLDSFTVTMTAHEPARFVDFVDRPDEAARWALAHLEPEPGVLVAVAVRRPGIKLQCRKLPGLSAEA